MGLGEKEPFLIRTLLKTSLCCLALLIGACGTAETPSGCVSCHAKLEAVSSSHPSCTECHGGSGASHDKDAAHRGMHGGAHPADFANAEKSCGRCHYYQLQRVTSNLMYTGSGMIRNIQLTWEGFDGKSYSARGGTGYDASGAKKELRPVAELDNLSGELYRKFCSRCHISTENKDHSPAGHLSGCAACHFSRNDDGSYQGSDPFLHGKPSHSASHTLVALPGNDACVRCHNRSGRIAFSYQGLYDGNGAQVPTRNGLPGPTMASGNRSLTHIAPDVHFQAGLDCIDCHTSRDVMGDGYHYRNMYLQTEIACTDCHGSGRSLPRHAPIKRENEEPLREGKRYGATGKGVGGFTPHLGTEMVLTAKGRPYSNVYVERGKIVVVGKRSGKRVTAKVITGTPEHTIAGHERLECYSCHSRTVVQCYGCHTEYDRRGTAVDFIKGKETDGDFTETEDYRSLYPFPLAINQRGKISPVTPGCQTFLTVIEKDGTKSKDEYVARFKGKPQLRFAPFYSHNTGKRALRCKDCHGNPAFLGFGEHIVQGSSIEGTLICEQSEAKPLDGFLTMQNGKVQAFSAVTREGSRPLSGSEVRRVFAVNLCLACHERGTDPIYRKKINSDGAVSRSAKCAFSRTLSARQNGAPVTSPRERVAEGGVKGVEAASPRRAAAGGLSAPGAPPEKCTVCHEVKPRGAHRKMRCISCHLDESHPLPDPAAASLKAPGCSRCHEGYQGIFSQAMGTRENEHGFVSRSYARVDGRFFEKKCASCHLKGCLDCHGNDGHRLARPSDGDCQGCHKGYYVGGEYHGEAPREDNLRFQRAPASNGETHLKMLPDVHAEAGLRCGKCHSMASLASGKKSSFSCTDCHKVSMKVTEHRIAAHLEKLECYACHSAWAPQEYGTFYLRGSSAASREPFDLAGGEEYLKSGYLKRQDAPPLGVNGAGKLSPIRPQFIAYFSDIGRRDDPAALENRLLAAEWKAFFPHTIRRGTPMCEACHDNPRRYLLERGEDRIYDLTRDGMTLSSFWDRTGQRVVNGSFYPAERYAAMSRRDTAYLRSYLQKWQRLVTHVEGSSPR